MSEKIKNPENLNYYIQTKNNANYFSNNYSYFSLQNDKNIKLLKFTKENNAYQLKIKSFKEGIFQLVFDLCDPKIKYKNKLKFGENLEITDDETLINDGNTLEINTTDDKKNKYKLVVDKNNLKISYYMNDVLTLEFNRKKTLNLRNDFKNNLTSNSIDFFFNSFSKVFGLPERPSHIFLQDGDYRLFNCDNYCASPGTIKPTYGCIPILHAVKKDSVVSIFCNNASDSVFDIKTLKKNEEIYGKEVEVITEGGILEFYITADSNFIFNQQKLSKIIGRAIMPPLWALGYHQCRWGYKDIDDLTNVVDKFSSLNIPYDCFWFDIEHTNDKRYFTWDPEKFPKDKVKKLLENLKENNRYFVTIIDPHIKKDEKDYEVCKELKKNDCFVKDKGEGDYVDFEAKCWPGLSYYVDFFNETKILPLYKNFYKNEEYFMNMSNFGTWVDMNEPSIFSEENEGTFPKTCRHFDGSDFVLSKEVHNLYGNNYLKIMHEALMSRYDYKKRCFVLTRSFFAGSQRYGFTWTGDQGATFDFMNNSIETNMINGLCGFSGCGTDIGGFDGQVTGDLLAAWYTLGPFNIFFRGHSAWNANRREPWNFDDKTASVMISSIKLRYNLLMFFYTKFYEHVCSGVCILRPAWIVFTENFDEFFELEDQMSLFIVGKEIMGMNNFTVSERCLKVLNSLSIPFYSLSGQKITKFSKNIQNLIETLFIGGSIIPWTEDNNFNSYHVMRSPLSIKVFCDSNFDSEGSYYLDDGETADYGNEFIYCKFKFKAGVFNSTNENKYEVKEPLKNIIPTFNKIHIYGYKQIKEVKLNKQNINYIFNEYNNEIIIDISDKQIHVDKTIEIKIE